METTGTAAISATKKLTERLCFICRKQRPSDNNTFNEGGIARFQEDRARDRLQLRTELYRQNSESKFFEAARCFTVELGWEVHDVYAADILRPNLVISGMTYINLQCFYEDSAKSYVIQC